MDHPPWGSGQVITRDDRDWYNGVAAVARDMVINDSLNQLDGEEATQAVEEIEAELKDMCEEIGIPTEVSPESARFEPASCAN